MMYQKFYFIIVIILLFCSCQNNNNSPFNIEFYDDYFVFEGKLFVGEMDIAERVYIPDYPNSYIEYEPDIDSDENDRMTKFRIVIQNEAYMNNFEVLPNSLWAGLPGNIPIPGVRKFGGSGVGNGFLPVIESQSLLGLVRVYQAEDTFGVFIETPHLNIPQDSLLTMRIKEKKRKGTLTLCGKNSGTGMSGFVIVFNKLLKVKKKLIEKP